MLWSETAASAGQDLFGDGAVTRRVVCFRAGWVGLARCPRHIFDRRDDGRSLVRLDCGDAFDACATVVTALRPLAPVRC
jgi:hypothetical protein